MLTHKRLLEVLYYDPATGVFTWRVNVGQCIKAGQVAGCKKPKRYVRIRFLGVEYKASRLAWFYMTGTWPVGEIDHKDGDIHNNVFSNLRDCSHQQNMCNSKIHALNDTGYKGVSWHEASKSYVARISVKRKRIHLGCFQTPEKAYAAYCEAANRFHKQFARV